MFLGCDVEQSVWSIVGAKDKIPEIEKYLVFFSFLMRMRWLYFKAVTQGNFIR